MESINSPSYPVPPANQFFLISYFMNPPFYFLLILLKYILDYDSYNLSSIEFIFSHNPIELFKHAIFQSRTTYHLRLRHYYYYLLLLLHSCSTSAASSSIVLAMILLVLV